MSVKHQHEHTTPSVETPSRSHDSGKKSYSLRMHQLACLQYKLKSPNPTTGYLVEVGVSGDIVAPFLGVDEGFSILLGLVHLCVHGLPSGQTAFHDVASLNRASVNCHECNKWIRKCDWLSLSTAHFHSHTHFAYVRSLLHTRMRSELF